MTAELSFASTAQRTSFSTSKQVWEQNGIVLTNNKGSGSNIADYANPARFYKNSEVIIEVPGKTITQIVFTCSSEAYAKDLQKAIGDVAIQSSSKVTVTFASGVENFEIMLSAGQVRMNSVTVTYSK